jgi:hypothetical protein
MKLEHLNQRFLESNPYEANPLGVALVRSIREKLLTPRPAPLHAGVDLFTWLLEMTDTNPTATSQGVRFVRITVGAENFVDVIEQ